MGYTPASAEHLVGSNEPEIWTALVPGDLMLRQESICQGGFHLKDEIPPINWNLSSFIHNYLRLRSIASIFTYKQIRIIRNNTIASVTAWDFNLISQINTIIFKQFDRFAVCQMVFQIYVKSIQQIQIINL